MEDKSYEDIVAELTEMYAEDAGGGVSQTLLVFSVEGEKYAVAPAAIREIVRRTDVFPVPFLPLYVRGLLNYYSKPYAVVDLALLLDKERQDSNVFLVLNDENSVSIQVGSVKDFYECSENMRVFINENRSGFFDGAFLIDGDLVPVIDVDKIISKVREDIERA